MTIFPLLLSMLITEYKSEKILTKLAFNQNRDIAKQTAEDIDQMFSEKIKALRIVVNTAEVKSMLPDKQHALLTAITKADADIQIVVISDSAGNQIARSDGHMVDDTITYRDREYFQKVKRTGVTVVSDVIIAKSTGYPGVVIAEPIKDENQQLVGVLIINVDLRTIIDRIDQLKIGQAGYAYLVNRDGHILLHPDRGMVEQDASWDAPVKAVMDKQTGLVEYEYEKKRKWAAFSYIPQTGWGLIVQQPAEEALADVSEVKRTTCMITIVSAILASLTGIAVANMMTRPITDISEAAARLAKGDLAARSSVATRNEIGHLATTFNFMADNLGTRTSALLESEEKYRSLVENISIGIYRETGDAKSFIKYANPALLRMLGYESIDELLTLPASMAFWSQEEFNAVSELVEQEGTMKDKEIRLRKKDGTALWCSMTALKHYNHQTDTFCIDSMIEDITERKVANEKLRQAHAELERKVAERTRELTVLNRELCRISLHDGLTCVANRRYFDEFLERECQGAKREKTSIALILLDVDFFKLYNDTYGHVAGDDCLRQIATALGEGAKRGTDLVARYGGEEFAVILPDTDQAGAIKVGERILIKVRELAIRHEMSPVAEIVTVSLGIAVAIPKADLTPEKMILAVDHALYRAKNSGRNQLQLAGELDSVETSVSGSPSKHDHEENT